VSTGPLSPGIKQPVLEADHTILYSTKFMNALSYTSTFPYIFLAWCLIKIMVHLHGALCSLAQGHIYLFLTNEWYMFFLLNC